MKLPWFVPSISLRRTRMRPLNYRRILAGRQVIRTLNLLKTWGFRERARSLDTLPIGSSGSDTRHDHSDVAPPGQFSPLLSTGLHPAYWLLLVNPAKLSAARRCASRQVVVSHSISLGHSMRVLHWRRALMVGVRRPAARGRAVVVAPVESQVTCSCCLRGHVSATTTACALCLPEGFLGILLDLDS